MLLIPPGQVNASELWVLAEDLASATNANRNNACDKSHRSKYLNPFTIEGRLESFKNQGFGISHNPSDDDSCQFSALSYLLQKIGIRRSARRFRQKVVSYLSASPENSEGPPLECFAKLLWSQYLNSMAQTGTYGDYITLQASSNLYNIELQIVSSLGNDSRILIQRQEFKPITSFYLGHFAESGGENYVSLDQISPNVVDFNMTIDGANSANTVNLDVATDGTDNDDAVGLGYDNDDTVGLNVAASDTVGHEVAADDAVVIDLAADGANNDVRAYLNVLKYQPRHIPYKTWAKILCHAIS